MERLTRIAHGLDRLNEWIGRGVAWLTLAMVLVTFAVVVLRYLFNIGSIAMQESITYMHAFVFMLGAAYTLRHNGHVRVDIFYRKMSAKRRALVDLLGAVLLLLPFCLFIAWASWDYVASSWELLEGSPEAGGIPAVFVLKTAIPAMAILLVLQGISMVIHSLRTLLGQEQPSNETIAREL